MNFPTSTQSAINSRERTKQHVKRNKQTKTSKVKWEAGAQGARVEVEMKPTGVSADRNA